MWQGAQVCKTDGSDGTVQAVKVVHKQQVMYNLTIDTAHSFFVGDKHFLVHNNNCDDYLTNAQNKGNPFHTSATISYSDDGFRSSGWVNPSKDERVAAGFEAYNGVEAKNMMRQLPDLNNKNFRFWGDSSLHHNEIQHLAAQFGGEGDVQIGIVTDSGGGAMCPSCQWVAEDYARFSQRNVEFLVRYRSGTAVRRYYFYGDSSTAPIIGEIVKP